jgi:hypothetical protein
VSFSIREDSEHFLQRETIASVVCYSTDDYFFITYSLKKSLPGVTCD